MKTMLLYCNWNILWTRLTNIFVVRITILFCVRCQVKVSRFSRAEIEEIIFWIVTSTDTHSSNFQIQASTILTNDSSHEKLESKTDWHFKIKLSQQAWDNLFRNDSFPILLRQLPLNRCTSEPTPLVNFKNKKATFPLHTLNFSQVQTETQEKKCQKKAELLSVELKQTKKLLETFNCWSNERNDKKPFFNY